MRRFPLLLLSSLLFVSCGKHETAAPPLPAAPSISNADATRFANGYRDALIKSNVQLATSMFDWDALLQKATVSDDVSSEFRQGFINGAKNAGGARAFTEQLSRMLNDGGQMKLLRIRQKGGATHAVVRVILPDGAVNYHEMQLERDAAGQIRASDIYIYTGAEYLSDTMRRMFLFAASQDPTFIQKLGGAKNPVAEHLDQYKALFDKLRTGDSKGAEAIFQSLPSDMRKQKSLLLAHVIATRSLGDDAYGKALDELRSAFPNDGAIDLMSIDFYILKHRDDDALKAIDRVDAAVGGDPYLDVMRANLFVRRGDLTRAREYTQRALSHEPDLSEASWTEVSMAMMDKNYAETARILTHLRDDLHVPIADLRQMPEYADFVKSPEYARWVK